MLDHPAFQLLRPEPLEPAPSKPGPEPGQLGDTIRRQREARGVSVTELADRLGMSPRTLTSWERGLYTIDAEQLPRLCQELGVSLTQLFGDEEGPRPMPAATSQTV